MKRERMIARDRLAVMVDGIFAFTMTLLVVDLRLPETFQAISNGALIEQLHNLRGNLVAFAITFFVLAFRWLDMTHLAEDRKTVSLNFASWTLLYLFFVCCMPFSTMLLGRYGTQPASVWVYALNMTLLALVALRLVTLLEPKLSLLQNEKARGLFYVIATAAASVAISFFSPRYAPLAYALNILTPLVERWFVDKTSSR